MDDIPEWSDAAKKFKLGLYRHFKGDEYRAIAVARHSETGEELVVYQSQKYTDRIWARPLTMFTDNVVRANYQGPRFSYLENQS